MRIWKFCFFRNLDTGVYLGFKRFKSGKASELFLAQVGRGDITIVFDIN